MTSRPRVSMELICLDSSWEEFSALAVWITARLAVTLTTRGGARLKNDGTG